MADVKKKKVAEVNPDFEEFFDSPEDVPADFGESTSGLIENDTPPHQSPYGDSFSTKGKPHGNSIDEQKESDSLRADELVELIIPPMENDGIEMIKLSINLKEFKIPVGESVMVPRYVRDYWIDLNKQKAMFAKERSSMMYND